MKTSTMILWRFKSQGSGFRFGFVSEINKGFLIRIGNYNGDYTSNFWVRMSEIEWEQY